MAVLLAAEENNFLRRPHLGAHNGRRFCSRLRVSWVEYRVTGRESRVSEWIESSDWLAVQIACLAWRPKWHPSTIPRSTTLRVWEVYGHCCSASHDEAPFPGFRSPVSTWQIAILLESAVGAYFAGHASPLRLTSPSWASSSTPRHPPRFPSRRALQNTSSMARKKITEDELSARAEANGYRRGAHQGNDDLRLAK